MSNYSVVYKIAGDSGKLLSSNKATFERLGRVIVTYNVKVEKCLKFGKVGDRGATFIAYLEIPAKFLSEVEKELKTEFKDPVDIKVGMNTHKSVKWKDEDENLYTTPYPSKEGLVK
jgi:hypothetical protein